MTMTITFTGNAAEIRQEMKVLLGITSTVPAPLREFALAVAEQTVDQQVEQAFGETKRGRGRPRKEVVEAKAEQQGREETLAKLQEEVVITPAVDKAPEPVTIEVLAEPAVETEIVVEQAPSLPVPGTAQDLMTAAMEIVKGDSAKKIALVKLLGSYGAKTINTLAAEHYAEFWEKVNAL